MNPLKSMLPAILALAAPLGDLQAQTASSQKPAQTQAGEKSVDPFQQNQRLGRGVNVIGYDPNFFVFNMKTQQWVEPILQALIPRSR